MREVRGNGGERKRTSTSSSPLASPHNLMMEPWCAVMFMPGLNFRALSAATWQMRCWPNNSEVPVKPLLHYFSPSPTLHLDMPTCCLWNRNWRLRLVTSIVSRSHF